MKRTLFFVLGLVRSVVACTTSACVFANTNLRFGNGAQTSVNNQGLFTQPFYFSPITSQWYQLTFSNYPLDTAIGTGNTSPHWSQSTIVDLYSLAPSDIITDYSDYIPTSTTPSITIGYGKITSYRTFRINNQNIEVKNVFTLGQTDNFVKTVTTFKNVDTTDIRNVNVWIGTRDDFVGTTDVNIKTRGNIVNGNFTAITTSSDESRAIMITNPTEGILFYSETAGVKTSYAMCCQFANAYNTNPSTLAPATPTGTDGSYAIVLQIGDLQPNVSSSITWYYAAGAISSLNSVVESVADAQVAESSAAPTPSETSTNTRTPSTTSSISRTNTPSKTSSKTSSPSRTSSVTASSSITSSVSPSQSLEANQSIVIVPFPTFYTRTPNPLPTPVPQSKDSYATTGIILGSVAGGGVLSLVLLQLVRNIRKPDTDDKQRRQSIESTRTQDTRLSTITEESNLSETTDRPSLKSNSPGSDSGSSDSGASEASKEIIEIVGGSTALASPAVKRNDEDNTFSLIKVNKDELNDVMNILRQRNKFASIYK